MNKYKNYLLLTGTHDHENFKITAQESRCQTTVVPLPKNKIFCYAQPIFCEHIHKFQDIKQNRPLMQI